jgi:hypothetical protein
MVMDVIPEAEWCQCAPKFAVDNKQYPPKAGTAKEMKKVCDSYRCTTFHSPTRLSRGHRQTSM